MPCPPPDGEGFLLRVRVAPGAKSDKILGYLGDELKISLTAPPQDGRANASLVKYLGSLLGLKQAMLSLQSGASSRSKILKIQGMGKDEFNERMAAHLGPPAGTGALADAAPIGGAGSIQDASGGKANGARRAGAKKSGRQGRHGRKPQ